MNAAKKVSKTNSDEKMHKNVKQMQKERSWQLTMKRFTIPDTDDASETEFRSPHRYGGTNGNSSSNNNSNNGSSNNNNNSTSNNNNNNFNNNNIGSNSELKEQYVDNTYIYSYTYKNQMIFIKWRFQLFRFRF